MATGGREEGSIAATSVLVGVAFIIFLAVSSFVGFLLSALSYNSIEIVWQKIAPYSMSELEKYTGSKGQEDELKERFKKVFGRDLEHYDLDKASNLCAYYIWQQSPLLGTVTGRFDAEKIMSQSSIMVSFILALADLWHYLHPAPALGDASQCIFLVSFFSLLLCMVACVLAFRYHRKKRVFGRYQIFLALSAKQEGLRNPCSKRQVSNPSFPRRRMDR